ncbi:arrestin domain-containing protein 1-like isoform X2 [Alosa sapidissima]|uniref:arrestin domain-containing protein 1-like isoform X2 n=1 Tax=Alosa sapidissima TaxID=34773 RepID=UPI001C085F2E|nr:arrestin domain-containing protein 1-like isoform X2 [Alosa sapidissima]
MATGTLKMEKIKDEGKLEISITDQKTVYGPGDTITGIVEIKNVEPIPSKAIKVNCRGYSGVSPSVSSRLKDTSWEVEEQYFNSNISMADKGILKNGSHTFPFTFVVPANAPSTYFGNYGRTIFEIRAFVDLPHFSNGFKAERVFYIQKPLNLNTVPNIQDISYSSVTKDFTYMLLKNGTIVLKATSDLRGYTPGQIIKLEIEIENRSGKSTSTVVASLIQVSLKSPDVLLTLPIFIGNVAVDTTHPSDSASSSAPPAGQEHKPPEVGRPQAEEIVTMSHSQPQHRQSVSPHSFHKLFLYQSFGSPETFMVFK